jgi:glucosamine--fructose-6-phosphate aminotransferase (isomerizing)
MPKMIDDIKECPERVRQCLSSNRETYLDLGNKLRTLNPAFVATVARGSSDHAACYASYLIPKCSGKVVASIPPSIVTVLNSPLNLQGAFAMAISQSGASPDILNTLSAVRESGALTAAIVNDSNSPVAKTAEVLLPQHAGSESIAATKSVLCTMAIIARLVATWTNDVKLNHALAELPDVLEKAVQKGMDLDDHILKGISNVYVLSRALGFSSALETALKLKETCGLHAEGFSTAEVRHGPREIVDERFLVIALALPGSGQEDIIATAQEMKAQGAKLLLIDSTSLPSISDSRLLPIVVLQMLYPWIARSSRAVGRDPDAMKTLKNKIIKTV